MAAFTLQAQKTVLCTKTGWTHMKARHVLLLRFVAQLILIVSVSAAAFGQGFGTFVGTVSDPTGAVIAGANIKVTDEATSSSRETKTNGQGYYVVPSLRPSTYTLTVDSPGFSQSVRKGIQLQADENLTVNQVIAVQQSNQAIEVSGEAIQVNTSTATSSEVV